MLTILPIPLLFTGKYRVGVITALLRRMQGWSLTSIYDEYARFAGADRVADEEVRVVAMPLRREYISLL